MRARERSGFTLIEIMTVLVVVAILAAIAYPSYLSSVRKAKRAEARAALMQLMQQEERYYSQHNGYIGFNASSIDPDEKRFKWYSGNSAAQSAYEIDGTACEDEILQNCVVLTAHPGTPKVDAGYQDAECGNLKLASTGVKGANKPDCW